MFTCRYFFYLVVLKKKERERERFLFLLPGSTFKLFFVIFQPHHSSLSLRAGPPLKVFSLGSVSISAPPLFFAKHTVECGVECRPSTQQQQRLFCCAHLTCSGSTQSHCPRGTGDPPPPLPSVPHHPLIRHHSHQPSPPFLLFQRDLCPLLFHRQLCSSYSRKYLFLSKYSL